MKNARLTILTTVFAVILLGISGLIWTGCNRSLDSTSSPVASIQAAQELQQSIATTMAVQDRHTDELLAISGVVGTGTSLGADGKPVFDDHALGCSICVDIATDVMQMTGEGRSPTDIRQQIVATYSKFGPANQ